MPLYRRLFRRLRAMQAAAPHRHRQCLLLALVAGAATTGIPARANAPGADQVKQQRAAENERNKLQQKLSSLKHDIDRTETEKSQATDALAQSERAISDTNRSLQTLADRQSDVQNRLAGLHRQRAALDAQVAAQQARLAGVLRMHYAAGNQDRTRLLLSGDDPNRIARELRYLGYLSKAQAQLLAQLQVNLQTISANQADTEHARQELDDIARQTATQKTALEKEKAARAQLLAQISGKLASQRREAGNLQRDAQRLSALVDQLGKMIAEQRRAEREAQQRRALAQAKRAQERQRAALAHSAAKDKPFKPDPIDDDEPPEKSSPKSELAQNDDIQGDSFPREFEALRGRMRLPVAGHVAARYGSSRSDGMSWKGLFIDAAEGSDVRAVAGGRIVFADWLRGFGNLVIVDHGHQYMTIYGNNQAILKRPGDIVHAGDIIARTGNTGGNEKSGLYFEMRHQGRTLDPSAWLAR